MTGSIVLVHGFWGGAAHWSKVILQLKEHGWDVNNIHAVELPLTGLADDSARLDKAIQKAEEPVWLVGHSYGGAVITEAGNHDKVKGTLHRARASLTPGLVFVAGWAPSDGEEPAELSKEYPPEAGPNIYPDSDGFLWIKPSKFHESFSQDLTEDESFVMAVTQKAPLAKTFQDKVTRPAWKHKPVWYQVSKEDRMIDPTLERHFAKRMNATVIELDSSHASLASHPEEVTKFILSAVKSG